MGYDVVLFARFGFPARKRQLWEATPARALIERRKWPKPLQAPDSEAFGERSVAQALEWLASDAVPFFFVSELVSSKVTWRAVMARDQAIVFAPGVLALMGGAGQFGGFGEAGLVTLESAAEPWGVEAALSAGGFQLGSLAKSRVRSWWRLPQVLRAQEEAVAAEKHRAPEGGLSRELTRAELKDFQQALREVGEVDAPLLKKVTAKDHYEVLTAKGTERTLAKLFSKREALLGALERGSPLVLHQADLQLMTLELYGDLLREAAYPLLRRWVKRARRYGSGTQSALRGLSFSGEPEDAQLILQTLKRFAPAKPQGGRSSAEDAYLFSPGAVSLERLEVAGLDRLILRELEPIARKKQPSFSDLAYSELLCLSLLTHQQAEVWPDLARLARTAKSPDLARLLGEYTSKCRVADAVLEYLPHAIEAGQMEHVAQGVLDLPDGLAVFEEATSRLEVHARAEWEMTLLHSLSQREDFSSLIETQPGWLEMAERLSRLDREITAGRAQRQAAQVLGRARSRKPRR
ncbi:MAG: hypothetical protein KC766_20580 [Myxococcales bacterium]|nr:hypothetical protein [Myxococcales bacterium]